MLSTRCRRAVTMALGLGLAVICGPAWAQSDALPQHFTAVAVNISNVGASGATPIDIRINRWTTDSERDKFLTTFREKGPDALLKALQSARPVGSLSTPGSLAYDLRYARELPGEDGGSRILLATDRPVSFWEATAKPRVSEYPFLLIELRVNKDGQGEGKLSIAARLTIDQDVLTIENYANQPVMLNQVRKVK